MNNLYVSGNSEVISGRSNRGVNLLSQYDFLKTLDNTMIISYELTPEALDKIIQAKKQFIENNEDPRKNACIGIEVAESWIRSRNYGINLFEEKLQEIPDAKEIQALLKMNKLLLQTAIPMIKKFMPLLLISNYGMLLTDKSGVVLYFSGDQVEVSSVVRGNYGVGTSCSEEKSGTTATYLSIIHKKPVQLVGPQNYIIGRENHIASSAPILNNANEVMGTLGIMQSFGGWDKAKNVRIHTLGWVASMANAISNQLELKSKNVQMETAYRTLDTTLSVIEEGFITLDHYGMITNINKEARQLLGIVQNDDFHGHYTKYFGCEPAVEKVFQERQAIHHIEISIGKNSQEQKCLVSIEPITNSDNTQIYGAVIRMTRASRIDKLVGRRGGTKASYTFNDIEGKSEALLKSLKIAKQISRTNANILLIGESGTGKELFAHALHNNYCPDGPFIAINCASMPRTLIASELFGYESGAFTGAEKKGHPGKFELADGGTIFLDEIGDLPFEVQPVLLRVLEDQQVMRLGGIQYIPVNVRIIAATNKDLLEAIKLKQFREDLYYRLAVFKIDIPPLRKRSQDALVLARYFVKETCRKLGTKPPELSEDACQLIYTYGWPGNVRQLENVMVYAVYMCTDNTITAGDFPEEITTRRDDRQNNTLITLSEMERDAIERAMRYTQNNTARAAKILGIGRTTLYRKLKEYSIDYFEQQHDQELIVP